MKKFLNDSLFLFLSSVVSKFSSFLVIPILTKYLTSIDYGSYDYFMTILLFFIPVVTLQIYIGILKNNYSYSEWKAIELKVVLLILLSSLLCVAVYSFFLDSLILCIWLFILLFTKGLLTVYDSILKSLNKVKIIPLSLLTETLIIIVGMYTLRDQLSLNLVMGILVLGSTLSLIINFGLSKYFYKRTEIEHTGTFKIKSFKKLVLFSIPLVPNAISIWLLRMSNRIVIVAYDGEVANAIFSIAFKYATIFTIIITAINSAWLISYLSDDDSNSHNNDSILNINLKLYFIISTIILLFTPFGIDYLSGNPELDSAVNYVPELVYANFLASIVSLFSAEYIKKGDTKSLLITTIVGGLINVVLCTILYKYLSLYSVGIAMSLSYSVVIILRVRYLKLPQEVLQNLITTCSLLFAFILMYRFKYNWQIITACFSLYLLLTIINIKKKLSIKL